MLRYHQILDPVPVSWNTRDVLLFANSIGCTDLAYLYEDHKAFSAFPTYPLMLSFKHAHTSTIPFQQHFDQHINIQIPGVPRLDSTKAVDGGRSLRVFRRLPVTSWGRKFMLRTNVEGVSDKGDKGTVVQLRHVVYESLQEQHQPQQSLQSKRGGAEWEVTFVEIRETVFYVGQGGWGGPKGVAPDKIRVPVEEKPILTHRHTISQRAHLLYRLNGDYNPLHADPESPSASTFGGVIMHGLYSWNVAARVIIEELPKLGWLSKWTSCPPALISFEGRFLSMVRPGNTLLISVWLKGDYGHLPSPDGSKSFNVSTVYSVNIESQALDKPCLIGEATLMFDPIVREATNKALSARI